MPELVHENNIIHSKRKSTSLNNDIPMLKLLLTPQVLSTLNEKELKPYWNQRCLELQSNLWLPHKNESPVPGSNLSENLLNYRAVKLNCLMTQFKPLTSIIPNSFHLSPHFATPIMENVQPLEKEIVVKTVKKIRIYPENVNLYHQMNAVFRRAYNLSVEYLNQGKYLDNNGKPVDIRPFIREQVKRECIESGTVYDVNVIQQAVKSAKSIFITLCKKNKNKKSNDSYSKLRFKSRKEKIQTFTLDRLPKSFMPCIKSLGRIFITESIPQEATGKEVSITCDHGRWFMAVQQHITLKSESQGQVSCIAIDPGVRTFATCYSEKEVVLSGKDFVLKSLLPLAKKIRVILSLRAKLKEIKYNDEIPKWLKDRLVYCEKELNKLECKRQDIVNDLHHKLAYYLVSNYDIIYLPSFETKKMSYRNKRSINRKVVHDMLSLKHYKFKQLLRWYGKKYGKHVVEINESYTSKTYSWNGYIDEKLGSKKIIKTEGKLIDRDINGARGIYIKQLSKLTSV